MRFGGLVVGWLVGVSVVRMEMLRGGECWWVDLGREFAWLLILGCSVGSAGLRISPHAIRAQSLRVGPSFNSIHCL